MCFASDRCVLGGFFFADARGKLLTALRLKVKLTMIPIFVFPATCQITLKVSSFLGGRKGSA